LAASRASMRSDFPPRRSRRCGRSTSNTSTSSACRNSHSPAPPRRDPVRALRRHPGRLGRRRTTTRQHWCGALADQPVQHRPPYTHSQLRLTTRLLDQAGGPVPDARVEILQQVAGSSKMQLVGSTVTRADGSLTAAIPAGPSRLIDLAYTASEGGPYTTQTEVFESVTAGLRLRVTPRHTTPTGTVQLEGQVLGLIPTHGVVVEVLVYYLGQWQPIRTPRTNPNGCLRLNYRFHQATGQFPFRLRVRYGQTGFPYGEACSRWVEVLA
jgi:5-hydroxyisourate hydrolase-like protein (transthyretin family)